MPHHDETAQGQTRLELVDIDSTKSSWPFKLQDLTEGEKDADIEQGGNEKSTLESKIITNIGTGINLPVEDVEDMCGGGDPKAFARYPRLHMYFEQSYEHHPDAIALQCGKEKFTYCHLEMLANRLAHFLLSQYAIEPGSRVCIFIKRSVHMYVSVLAVLKCGATYVPMDAAFPSDRLLFMAHDSEANLLLTMSDLANVVAAVECPVLVLDKEAMTIANQPHSRPAVRDTEDRCCYVIYTSGTTGKPKGVAITHSNICNYISVIVPLYGVSQYDRVYQGITIAFDFSFDEIWVTFAVGATVVAGPVDHHKIGSGLAQLLDDENITVLHCCPTLLHTIDRDLPSVRIINTAAEACSEELVRRWSPGRIMFNTYGPTETTVTATLARVTPGKPVTIGKPLPTFTIHILDQYHNPVPRGKLGELWIGGPAVAKEYINQPEKTAAAFYPNFLEPPKNGEEPGRLFRTGDIGRYNADGEIEMKGRIDDQIKIRGYRIEVAEVEAVIHEHKDIANVVVKPVTMESGKELAAFVTLKRKGQKDSRDDPRGSSGSNSLETDTIKRQLHDSMCSKLPPYMIPAFLEVIDKMPTLPSGKTDKKSLRLPVTRRLSSICSDTPFTPPKTVLEHEIHDVFCCVFGVNKVSVAENFFTDLGGHSMAAAQVVSKFRQGGSLPLKKLGISEIYEYPTIQKLCRFLQSFDIETGLSQEKVDKGATHLAMEKEDDRIVHSSAKVWVAGVFQFFMFYPWAIIFTVPFASLLRNGVHWLLAVTMIGSIALPGLLVLPILAKWLLIGRYKPGRYPLWGPYYVRLWVASRLMAISPLRFLEGSPLLSPYMRLFGARIGRGCHLGSARLFCPDLIDIGDGVSIGYGAAIDCYVVKGGYLYLAPVKIGRDAFIGNGVVVLPGSRVGAESVVLELSLVSEGQVIPDGETWCGSPSQRTMPDPVLTEMASRSPPQSWPCWLTLSFLGVLLFFFMGLLPTMIAAPAVISSWFLSGGGFHTNVDIVWMTAYSPIAGVVFVASTCFAIAISKHVIMHRTPLGIFPLRSVLGLRKWATDNLMVLSLALTNSLYSTLYTSPWLRALGATIGPRSEVSTVSTIDPDLMQVEEECFFADQCMIGPARHHHGSIFTDKTEIGRRTFIGNAALVNSGTKLKDNVLIGVLTLPPRDQDTIVSGSNWLGSPAFFLPRREIKKFSETTTYRPPAHAVALRWVIEFFRIVMPAALTATTAMSALLVAVRLEGVESLSVWALGALYPGLYLFFAFAMYLVIVFLKWIIVGRYHKKVAPLWALFVRRSEFITALYECAAVPGFLAVFLGTPFIAPLLRLLGCRIGARAYLETTFITEFDLVQLGDDVAVGMTASLQTHLFEDRVMKMDVVSVGNGVSIGAGAIVLYGCHVEKGAEIDALSLVMKGERIPPDTLWRGIPCKYQGTYELCRHRSTRMQQAHRVAVHDHAPIDGQMGTKEEREGDINFGLCATDDRVCVEIHL